MSIKKLFIKLTIFLYIIAVLHFLALYFSWYWSIWWYDIPMHIMGGFWVGGMVLWLYFLYRKEEIDENINRFRVVMISLVATLIIGILWELFEFSLDTFVIFKTNDLVDTASDIINDIIGSLLISFYVIQKSKYYYKNILK